MRDTQSDTINRQWLLTNRPDGWPETSDFTMQEAPLPQAGAGEVLVRILWVSVDPYMRGRMRDRKSYMPPVPLGGVMEAGAVGVVQASNHAGFKVGDCVEGRLGWQDYALSDGKGLRVVDPGLAPLSTALGVLGMPGLTAYFGLLEICDPQPGQTVLVSGGAGAVGSIVGQIAKIKNCRVVGVAGTAQKVSWLTDELGFDAAFDYKTTSNLSAKLGELCPEGIHHYFDNVGGEITDAAFAHLAVGARVAVCGQISQYNLEKPQMGPRNLWTLITAQARVEGFLVFQFAQQYKEGLAQMSDWIKEGRLKYRETVTEGLESTPRAFIDMMRGDNTGKAVVHVAHL